MKEIIYNITQQTEGRKVAITGVNEPVYKNNVLGIINKTQSKVLYTPLQYANLVSSEWSSLDGGTLTLTLADNVQIINVGDKLFVKLYLDKDIDFSALAKEDTLTQGISSVASKVEEVGNKIDNIKLPEIDTTELASKDLERFFGVKPIDGYEFMTAEEICAELEEIMTSMDLELTQEMAATITNNTLNEQ